MHASAACFTSVYLFIHPAGIYVCLTRAGLDPGAGVERATRAEVPARWLTRPGEKLPADRSERPGRVPPRRSLEFKPQFCDYVAGRP